MPYLLSALRKYPVTDSLDPRENFVTEALCFLLSRSPTLSLALLEKNGIRTPGPIEDIKWETQVQIKGGFLDLLGTGENFAIIFENKVCGGVGEHQLGKYRDYLDSSAFTCTQRRLVALTPYRMKASDCQKHNAEAFTWPELCDLIHASLENGKIEDEVEIFLCEEFMNLMEVMGMGKVAATNLDALKSFYETNTLQASVTALFSGLRDNHDWKAYFENMPRADEEKRYQPRSVTERWGRIGIEFGTPSHGDWELPCLGFLALMDTRDHKIEPSQPKFGPDLCLTVDIDHRTGKKFLKGAEFYDSYMQLVKEFEALAKKLGNGWQCYDHIAHLGKRGNTWHPLYLRRPLSAVLEGHTTFEAQQRALENEMKKVLGAVIGVGGKCETPAFFELRKLIGKKSGKAAA